MPGLLLGQQKAILKNHELKQMVKAKKDIISSTEAIKNSDSTKAESNADKVDYKLKGFNLGLGIGGSLTLNQNLVSPTISPLDNKLQIDNNSNTNFTLTTLFMIPMIGANRIEKRANAGKDLRATVYQYGTKDKDNTTYVVPHGPYLIFNINYNDFTKAASVKPFNQTINGGMGIGWRFNDFALAALTLDATSYKQPKQFLMDNVGKTLQTADGKNITTIDTNDTNYFKDITAWSLSLKIVYILTPSSN